MRVKAITEYRTRILVVEDNEVNQLVSKAMLERLNFEVTMVNNGLEAINAYSPQQFDLILMDCNMPVMDGFEATRRIRSLEQLTNAMPTPIVALTAHAFDHVRQECFDAGMNEPCLSGCLPMIAHGGVSGLKVVCGRISASRTSAIRTLV